MNPLPRAISGWIALGLWGLSLIGPYSVAGGYGQPPEPEGGDGLILLFWGWLGPFFYSFAWFANFPFGLAVYRLIRGRLPGYLSAVSSAIIGYSVLIPHRGVDPRAPHWRAEVFVGPAIHLWLAALTIVALAQFIPAGEDE